MRGGKSANAPIAKKGKPVRSLLVLPQTEIAEADQSQDTGGAKDIFRMGFIGMRGKPRPSGRDE